MRSQRKKTKQQDDFVVMLRDAGLKVTPARVHILTEIFNARMPLSVDRLVQRLGRRAPNLVTVYRVLKDLYDAQLIRSVDLQHGHIHYELAASHHHHLVCSMCGVIQDIKGCSLDREIAKALKQSSKFRTVTEHSFELFGLCVKCEKRA